MIVSEWHKVCDKVLVTPCPSPTTWISQSTWFDSPTLATFFTSSVTCRTSLKCIVLVLSWLRKTLWLRISCLPLLRSFLHYFHIAWALAPILDLLSLLWMLCTATHRNCSLLFIILISNQNFSVPNSQLCCPAQLKTLLGLSLIVSLQWD